MRNVLPVVAVLALSCSSAPSPQQQAARDQFQRTVPTCESEADCKAKWEAAKLWIVRNSAFKLQTVTDEILETYEPKNGSRRNAVRVIREPLGEGRYRLVVSCYCANALGCVPDSWQLALDFNRTVGAAIP